MEYWGIGMTMWNQSFAIAIIKYMGKQIFQIRKKGTIQNMRCVVRSKNLSRLVIRLITICYCILLLYFWQLKNDLCIDISTHIILKQDI